MKKLFTFAFLLLSLASFGQTKRTINVETAGTLPTLISDGEKYAIEELTLTGNLNGTDFRLLRDMAGNNWEGNPTEGKLVKIDLSGARIVAGGENYVDTKSISGASGRTTTNSQGFIYTTENDVFGPCLFAGCENLQEIKFPSGITFIGYSAFHFDSSLKELVLPKSLLSFSDFTYGCSGLISLSVEDGNPVFTSPAGSNAILQGNKLVLGCTETVIPDNVTIIGNSAFVSCGKNGQTMTLPVGVTEIEIWNFVDCYFDEVILPEGITTIGDYFLSWSAVKRLTIPSTVKKIGDNSLNSSINGCYNMTEVISKIADPTAVEFGTTDVFTSLPENAVLYVPKGSVDDYKATEPWNNFKEIVALEDGTPGQDDTTDEDVITISSTGKGTYCSEYDLDFTGVDGIKAYTATGYDNKTKTIWVTRVYSVPAGTGIMLKGDPGEYKIPRVESQSAYANFFVGNLGSKITINETDGDKSNYYMKNGQFVSVSGTANISANRCYLQLPTSVFAGTRSIGIVYGDGETTSIDSMDNAQGKMNISPDVFYNLQGQRVENPTKGIYIKNGKKVLIK
jgi:hypothetical protein